MTGVIVQLDHNVQFKEIDSVWVEESVRKEISGRGADFFLQQKMYKRLKGIINQAARQ